MEEDEYFDDEFMEDFYFDEADELQTAEVDFRVEKCLSILREVAPIAQINLGWIGTNQDNTQIYHKGYGDIPPFGKGPDQQKIFNRGNNYIREEFPNVDFIKSCELEIHDEIEEEEELVRDLEAK